MIVSLASFKAALGIAPGVSAEDDNLTRLITTASVVVEGLTKRRFREPIAVTEFRKGDNNRILYLRGHIDDANAVDSATLDPALHLTVSRRALILSTEWEVLTALEDYERRADTLLFLRMWNVWTCEDEFKIEYLDGYTVAPDDIYAVVLELAMKQYLTNIDLSSGTIGIKSESLGDFSYSVDSSILRTMSETSMLTIQRYKRRFV